MKKILLSLITVGAALGAVVHLWSGRKGEAQTIDPSCFTSGSPETKTGTALQSLGNQNNGIIYDGTGTRLTLKPVAGQFRNTTLGVTSPVFSGCAADFDGDGWSDFVATGNGLGNDGITLFRNETFNSPVPDWSNPNDIRTPLFTPQAPMVENPSPVVPNNLAVMGCADVNGDGKKDFVYLRCTLGALCVPNRHDIFLGNGNGTFQAPYSMTNAGLLGLLGNLGWTSNAIDFIDYNKDGHLDIVMGQNWSLLGLPPFDQRVVVLLNDGASPPEFNSAVTLLTGLNFGARGPVTVGVGDFNADTVPDIVVGGPATQNLFMYPGLLGGGLGTPEDLNLPGYGGGATAILVGDFTKDGKTDILVGTDGLNGFPGGKVYFYEGNGTATPFSAGIKQTITTASADFDLGWAFDYDHDPDGTPDFLIADGNNSNAYYLFANRTLGEYVPCGTIVTDPVNVGSLATTESTVTSVRLTPDPPVTPATEGTITYEASNDDGNTWHLATPCPDDATKRCVNFSTSNGSQIRWRINMCSVTGDPTYPDHTRAPILLGMSTEFTYVTAQNHFRAGPIARDGIIYVGAFRMPGNAGHVFALDDQAGTTLWDAATVLDATSPNARHVFTVADDGTRLDFNTATTSDPKLQAALLAVDQTVATDIVNWFFSPRFGFLPPLHQLGAIENSTPALLSPPSAPYWYVFSATSASEKTAIDAYMAANATRPQLLFIGAKDGALHAFRTNPADPVDPTNGSEAWAFIPFDVAQRMLGDKTAGGSDLTAYVDGSPTLVSAKINGNWRSVLIAGEANGGRAVFALDVTDTIASDGTVTGPTPLWRFQDANMGRTYSKPTVIRTQHAGSEVWMAVFASGPSFLSDVGDTVYAVDLSTGALLWRFDLNDASTYISTDITASETDDESGTAIDGFIDRVFFADSKGRIWKLDPGAFAVDGTIAPVGSTVDVGLGMPALFSTRLTTGALGEDRAVAGTLTAATDAANRLTLYFGTGGTEETPPNVQNAFYAVYADTGEVRSKLDQSTGLAVGIKFYGGVVYNNGQLVFTQGEDLSGLGLCAASAGSVVALDANTFAVQFETPAQSKIVAPIYAQEGEIYTVTITGKLMASQFVGSSGGGTPGGGGPGGGGPGGGPPGQSGGSTTDPFRVLGWRQL